MPCRARIAAYRAWDTFDFNLAVLHRTMLCRKGYLVFPKSMSMMHETPVVAHNRWYCFQTHGLMVKGPTDVQARSLTMTRPPVKGEEVLRRSEIVGN